MPSTGWRKTSQTWDDQLGITAEHREALAAEVAASNLLGTAPEESNVSEATFDKLQMVTAAQNDANMLSALAAPAMFRYLLPPVILAIWSLLTQKVITTRTFFKIALGIPRGHGKTTIIKIFVLYCILFTNKKFILIISSTSTLAENILADITDMLDEPNIISLFGDWKLGRELSRQDLKKFGFRGRNIILAAIGAGGSLRGLNIKNERPDIIIFEDIQTKECSESAVQTAALERWMIGTAMKAASPHGCLYIFCGNMYPGMNSLLKKLKTNKTWIKFISGAILLDGSALWEELRPLSSLLEELDDNIAMGHPEIFFSEVMNETEIALASRIDFSKIREWKFSEYDRPQGKFIIIDPASDKRGSDLVSIGYCEVYDGVPYLRKLVEGAFSPGNTILQALYLAITSGTKVIAVESTSYQYSLLYWFGEKCKDLSITGLHFVDVYSGSLSKNSRITSMLSALTAAELGVHDEVRSAVVSQIANWNPLKRDNVDGILDLLAYMPRVMDLYGPLTATEAATILVEASEEDVQEYEHAF